MILWYGDNMITTDVQQMVASTSGTNKTKCSNALSYCKDAFDNVGTTADKILNIQCSHISPSTGLFIFELDNGIVVSVNIGVQTNSNNS